MDEITLRRDLALYQRAVELAAFSGYTTKVGCVSAKNSKVNAAAANRIRNPIVNVPVGQASYHAEMLVLQACNEYDDLSKFTFYIARLGKLGQELPSRPCRNCMILLKRAGVGEIVYRNMFGATVKEVIKHG